MNFPQGINKVLNSNTNYVSYNTPPSHFPRRPIKYMHTHVWKEMWLSYRWGKWQYLLRMSDDKWVAWSVSLATSDVLQSVLVVLSAVTPSVFSAWVLVYL